MTKQLDGLRRNLACKYASTRPHCVRWGSISPKRRHSPIIFGPCLLWSNGWMDQDATWYGGRPHPRRLCVRCGPALPSPKMGQSPLPNFRPISIVAKRLLYRCMHQDATWYGGRPQPRGLCVRWEPSPLNFLPMFIIVIVISLEHCTKHSRYWFIQVQVQVLYSMHSIFRKV